MFKEDFERAFVAKKLEKYRANQVFDWVFKKNVNDFSEMNNLPLDLREKLSNIFTLDKLKILTKSKSDDGTCKYLLELSDGNKIECVYLPYEDRKSICVSTQIGCAVGCSFCASGDMGFERNLTASEIINQILIVQNDIKEKITHVVFMGIGEPLLNMDNVPYAIKLINHNLEISQRRITISTVGIIRGIKKLADMNLDITLALSLHEVTQDKRAEIIPIAKLNLLDDLLDSCDYYFNKTKRRITFEYLLIDGINSSPYHGNQLARIARKHKAHINIIPYNIVDGKNLKRPSKKTIDSFCKILSDKNIVFSKRMEKGSNEQSACGQLRINSSK